MKTFSIYNNDQKEMYLNIMVLCLMWLIDV